MAGRELFSKLFSFKSIASLMTKFKPPKDETGKEFSTFMLVLFSNTNLGDSTKAVKYSSE